MKEILLDTSAYSEFKRGNSAVLEHVQTAHKIWLSTIAHGELLAGFAAGSREKINRSELDQFLSSARVATVGVDSATAERYAIIYAFLRREGKPIPTNDLWIAATAMQLGVPVVTADRHFQLVPQIISYLVGPEN